MSTARDAVSDQVNVLLVNLPAVPFDENRATRSREMDMPLGLMYISAYIKKHNPGVNVQLLDYVLNIDKYTTVDEYINTIADEAKFHPDVIGFSLNFSSSYKFFARVLEILGERWPMAVTVAGGVHATNTAEYLLENTALDYVVCGEGEKSFSDFLKASHTVKGLCLSAEPVANLDNIPYPDWDLIDMDKYTLSNTILRNVGSSKEFRRNATTMTTRGCPFQCTFCSSHTVHGRKVRYRTIDNILGEVRELYERYGVTLFTPYDDVFSMDKNRVLKVLQGIKGLSIPNFELQCPNALSVSTLDAEVMDALIDAGMKVAYIAIESGSEYVQKNIIKKRCNLSKAREVVAYFRAKGITVKCLYILGFPGETVEQMRETIEYAKSVGANWSTFSIAIPLVGTEMYEQFVEMGCIKHNDPDLWRGFIRGRLFDTPEISAKDLENLAYRANLECNFIGNIGKQKAVDMFQDVTANFPFHAMAWYCTALCYELDGDMDKFEEAKKSLEHLLRTNVHAMQMVDEYPDLFPRIEAGVLV